MPNTRTSGRVAPVTSPVVRGRNAARWRSHRGSRHPTEQVSTGPALRTPDTPCTIGGPRLVTSPRGKVVLPKWHNMCRSGTATSRRIPARSTVGDIRFGGNASDLRRIGRLAGVTTHRPPLPGIGTSASPSTVSPPARRGRRGCGRSRHVTESCVAWSRSPFDTTSREITTVNSCYYTPSTIVAEVATQYSASSPASRR